MTTKKKTTKKNAPTKRLDLSDLEQLEGLKAGTTDKADTKEMSDKLAREQAAKKSTLKAMR